MKFILKGMCHEVEIFVYGKRAAIDMNGVDIVA